MRHLQAWAIAVGLTLVGAGRSVAQTFDFASGEEGWYVFSDPLLYSSSAYVVDLDASTGSPSAPSLRLRGNFSGTAAAPQRFGMRREVSTGGSGTMTVSFRYRLTCHPDYAGAGYSNLWLRVRDGGSSDRLAEIQLYPGAGDAPTSDTGWRNYTSPSISSAGTSSMSIQIFLKDATPTLDPDIDQRILIDRVIVAFADSQPPAAPTGIAYSPNPSTGDFIVAWGAPSDPSGIAGYNVRRSSNGGSTWTTVATSITGTSLVQTGVAPGVYIYQVAARDGAGNLGAYSANVNSITVATDPAPVVAVAPTDISRSSSPITFTITFNEPVTGLTLSDVVVTNGVKGPLAGLGGYYLLTVAPSAQGTVTVFIPAGAAVDATGNPNVASNLASVTFDSVAPETTLMSVPALFTTATSAIFAFSSNEAGAIFESSLDGGAYAVVTSPASIAGLTAGNHVFRVRARDAAGNVDATPATHSWTVDSTAPETSFSAKPPPLTGSTSATFAFTSNEAGVSYEASLDGAAYAAVANPVTLTNLAEGAHVYRVRARDAAGNVDPTPAKRSWTVETSAPIAGTVADGPSADVDEQSSFTTLWANWGGFSDAQSGIAGYEWAVGTEAGLDNVVAFRDLGLATSASTSALLPEFALNRGVTYFVTIRARNKLGLTTAVSSDGVRIQEGAEGRPEPPAWRSLVAGSSFVELDWWASPTTTVTNYRLWWKRADLPWSAAVLMELPDVTSATIDGLMAGTPYDIQLRAVDGAGNESVSISAQLTPFVAQGSDGVMYGSLPEALSVAKAGDTVRVAAGVFSGSFTVGAGVSLAGAGARHTRLIGVAGQPTLLVAGTATSATGTISDLAIENGSVGADVAVAARLERVIVHRVLGPGVRILGSAKVEVVNCTVLSNAEAGVLVMGEAMIRNTILGRNGGAGVLVLGQATVRYSTMYGNTGGALSPEASGIGNDAQPARFLDEEGGDYREAPGSPTIDSGDPEDDFAREPEPSGGRINRGAFGNTAWAGTSAPLVRVSTSGGGECGLVGWEAIAIAGVLFMRRRMYGAGRARTSSPS